MNPTDPTAGYDPGCLDPAAFAALLDGTLSAHDESGAHAHLATCPLCREEYDDWQELDAAGRAFLDADPGDPPDIPGYRVVRPLGRGGFGTVWLAEHHALGSPRALKALPPALLSPGEISRLRDEGRAADGLARHPHLIQIHDLVNTARGPVLVMEYVAGGPVAGLAPLKWEDALRFAAQAADALDATHRSGNCHGDVTPWNLLHDPARDAAVLTDFGLGVRSGGGGTPGFVAPERHTSSATPATDVFGLAATLSYLLTGTPPGQKPLPDVPAEVATLIVAALATNPTDRPTAAAFRDRARAALSGWVGGRLEALVRALSGPVELSAAATLHDLSGTQVARTYAAAGPSTRVGPTAFLAGETGLHLTIEVTANRPGFFVLVSVNAAGEVGLFASPDASPAGKTCQLSVTVKGPPGIDRVAVVWTAAPPRHTAAEWRAWVDAPPSSSTTPPVERTLEPAGVTHTNSLSAAAAVLFTVAHQEPTR